jgi:hypothetical protein
MRPDDNRRVRGLIRRRLQLRWAKVIEEDQQTDGFWDEVAEAIGLDRCGLTSAAERYALQATGIEAQRMIRRAKGEAHERK